ncbi:tetratricopeptide repeat protein [Gillisia sp. JM1]|uniref:tetratricopeptide repeat protein n=1 Tax=Gillisia sp. JM1 TaxID=1283286 RepID=UPI0003F7EFD9|nr:tetratricopeptide repeat protein [Gillisia sp. JM1]
MKLLLLAFSLLFSSAIVFCQTKEVLYNNSLDKYLSRDYDGVISDLNIVIELDSNYKEALFWRGVSKTLIDDYKGSILDLDKAIKLDPTSSKAYFHRGATYLLLKDKNRACADFNRASELGHKGVSDLILVHCKD